MEGCAGAGVGLQPRRRRGQAGPLHVRAGSRVGQAEEGRDHAQVWRRFLLRKGQGCLRHERLLRELGLRCKGISGLAERFVDDEMRVEIWCGTSVCDAAARRVAQVSTCARGVRDGVVCMMRAFSSGGMLGPIIALSHKCPAIAGRVIAASRGYDLAVVEGRL